MAEEPSNTNGPIKTVAQKVVNKLADKSVKFLQETKHIRKPKGMETFSKLGQGAVGSRVAATGISMLTKTPINSTQVKILAKASEKALSIQEKAEKGAQNAIKKTARNIFKP